MSTLVRTVNSWFFKSDNKLWFVETEASYPYHTISYFLDFTIERVVYKMSQYNYCTVGPFPKPMSINEIYLEKTNSPATAYKGLV